MSPAHLISIRLSPCGPILPGRSSTSNPAAAHTSSKYNSSQQKTLSATTMENQNPTKLCEECVDKEWKYKCPGCSIRTCSLGCVKAHKKRTGCSGKRSVTHFVPLSSFDDNVLLSDYNFLEETKRVAESATRLRGNLFGSNGHPYCRLPKNLRFLKTAASSRTTRVLFLPNGMSRRVNNQTRYDRRKKLIKWTIEWRFHSTDVVIVDHEVCEDSTLSSVIENHLSSSSPWNCQLKHFCELQLDCLKFFIRMHPKSPNSPFRELDIKATIRQQLSNLVLLEYPTIYVFLPSQRLDFEVVKDLQPVGGSMPVNPESNVCESPPKGVSFKEEEIVEDVSCSGTKVVDAIKSEKSSSGLKVDEMGTTEELLFDFDQGLIDAYSDLIADINPDDFLDFEGIFAKEDGVHEKVDFLNLSGSCLGVEELEELEEGEIPDD